MRRDRLIFDGKNPFSSFAACKELTVLLDKDRFIFIGSINAISILRIFPSKVTIIDESEEILNQFTIPLSLIISLFKLDTQETENVLTLETSSDTFSITYNGVPVESDIYSANGATMRLIESIDIDNSVEVAPRVLISMIETFGTTKDTFCDVQNNMLSIADHTKTLIKKIDLDFERSFALPAQFIRLMKTMNCSKLFIGKNAVGQAEDGAYLITNLYKISNPNSIQDYRYAKRLKPIAEFQLKLGRYIKQISAVVSSAELSVSLDLAKGNLILSSSSGEKSIRELEDHEYIRTVTGALTSSELQKFLKEAQIGSQQIIRTLALAREVTVKLCGTLFLVKLDKGCYFMFPLERAA